MAGPLAERVALAGALSAASRKMVTQWNFRDAAPAERLHALRPAILSAMN